jgi:DNA-binding GntR family transcriptional regulator
MTDNSNKYNNKSGRVYKQLREDILQKKFLPGERLVERELVKKLDASSIIVREALSNLSRDGLVTLEPYRGATVTKLTHEDINEMYELREELDSFAAKLAAQRITDEKAAEISDLIKKTDDELKKGRLDYDTAIKKMQIHDLIGELSGNSRIKRIIHDIHNQSRLLIRTSLASYERPKNAYEEEKRILKSIIERNAKAAEKHARQHIRSAKKIILMEMS